MAQSNDHGANTQRVGVCDGGRHHSSSRHAKKRKVRVAIERHDVGVDASIVGERDVNAKAVGHVRVRHDEIRRPEDAGTAAVRTVDLDRDLTETVGDLGQMRRRFTREKDAHRP